MRMRKKKNLLPRMEACRACQVQDPFAMRGHWRELMPDARELRVELGCGKGRFTVGTAQAEPDVLLIAVEKVPDAMVVAMERAQAAGLHNVFFVVGDAALLPDMFAPAEVDRLYINFCDPWPKSNQKKRRLTHGNFLKKYRQVLAEGGQIHFKTDNDKLFCLRIDTVIAMGGSQSYAKIFSVDKKSGKQITLKNLFKKGSGYIDRISDNIKEQMRAQMKENADVTYFVDDENNKFNFKSISNKTNFYVNEKGKLTLVFDKYEVAPGYMGMVEFSIPTGEIVDMVTNGYLK